MFWTSRRAKKCRGRRGDDGDSCVDSESSAHAQDCDRKSVDCESAVGCSGGSSCGIMGGPSQPHHMYTHCTHLSSCKKKDQGCRRRK